jgi:DNA-directed RNA polymerase specialized sigma24 family protein
VDLEDIFRRCGQEWAEPEKQVVIDWLVHSGELDQLVRLVDAQFRCRRDTIDDPYLAAQKTVDSKIRDAFRYYNPTRPRAAPFPGYLKSIVIREIARVIGKAKKKPRPRPLEWDPEAPPVDEESPEQDWCTIEPLLERLLPKYREALVLCKLQPMSCREAGQRSQWPCSEGAMKVRVFRAKQELRRLDKDDESREDDQ